MILTENFVFILPNYPVSAIKANSVKNQRHRFSFFLKIAVTAKQRGGVRRFCRSGTFCTLLIYFVKKV
jgi:hypothetical protein